MNNLLILHNEKGYSYKDLIEALNDIKFRGKYFNFVKNNPIFKKYIENVLEYNFGPRVTIHKINQEKKQGFKFPIKTKESLENFLQDLNIK